VSVAFLTTVLPGDRRGGGEIVSQAFVDALRSSGAAVNVVGYRRQGSAPPVHADDVAAGERPIETAAAGARAALWLASGLARREPYSFAKYRSRQYRAAARRLLERRPGLVVLDHAQSAAAAGHLDGATPVVYLAHNVEHEIYGELAATAEGPRAVLLRREAALVRRLETALAGRAAEVWALTDADAAALERLGARRTRSFAVPPTGSPEQDPPPPDVDVALLGTWTWESNAAGLRWFRDRVLPELPEGVTVAVAGAGSEAVGAANGRVRALGVVGDALQFLRRARVVAIPSVAGSGVQVKTLDAIASGRRVVATPVAARGLGDLPPTVTVADGPAGFAAALAQALAAPEERAAEEAASWTARREREFGEAVAAAARPYLGGSA
jgi:hypothetical protein